ncbi:MAG: VWA domain-containing protein [Candidatus Babeliales bacterium]
MDYFFRLAHKEVAFFIIIVVLAAALWRYKFYKSATYSYSLTHYLTTALPVLSVPLYKIVPFVLRLLALLVLALLVARPQLVNVHSKVHVEGHDIMLVLDASGSMQCFDDLQDKRPRFQVAKEEAIRFIEKRQDDQVGLVIFGKDAISRCPLTLDHHILKGILEDLKLGDIDPDGTVLSIALSMAANRLKQSKAKTKLIIALTDGEPTPGVDIQPQIAVALAKKLGVKIYTIGIGNDQGGFWYDPLFGVRSTGFKVNKDLLRAVSSETGGKFFYAHNPDELAKIYDAIDQLEKTEYETSVFSHYYELTFLFISLILILLLIELLTTTFVWFRV